MESLCRCRLIRVRSGNSYSQDSSLARRTKGLPTGQQMKHAGRERNQPAAFDLHATTSPRRTLKLLNASLIRCFSSGVPPWFVENSFSRALIAESVAWICSSIFAQFVSSIAAWYSFSRRSWSPFAAPLAAFGSLKLLLSKMWRVKPKCTLAYRAIGLSCRVHESFGLRDQVGYGFAFRNHGMYPSRTC
jgi:hypothetical protein